MKVKFAEDAANAGGLYVSASECDGKIGRLEIGAMYETIAEAEAVAARFPKGIKIKGGSIHTKEGVKGWVSCHMAFYANETTGERNDASIARARKFFAASDKLGIPLFCDEASYLNSIVGRTNIEAAIAAL